MKVVTGFAILTKKGFNFGKHRTKARPNKQGPMVVKRLAKSFINGMVIFVAFVNTLPIVYK